MPGKPDKVPAGAGPTEPQGTRLESDEEIRQALEARRARLAPAAPAAPATPTAAPRRAPPAPPPEPDVQPDRPLLRPPMALLCVLDDGKPEGEWVRLRADRTVIGRAEGDVRIPHDGLMSARHAEIVRQKTANGWRWVLVDLRSTNGTFVRVGGTILRNGNELLVGAGRYRFEAGGAAAAQDPAPPNQTTRAWSPEPTRGLVPSLVELSPAGPVHRFSLTLPEYWVGRDPKQCALARPDDLLASPRHARLFRDPRGQWHAENNKSLNGLWFRVEDMPLTGACQFRLGEQRFLFRMP